MIYWCTGAWCCTLLLSWPHSWTGELNHCIVQTSIVAGYAYCPTCWGCLLALSADGENCLLYFFLWKSVVVCCTWLLCPCLSCCSYLQLMDSCWFLRFSHILDSACYLFIILWPATTLEVLLLPTFIAFYISLGVMAWLHSSSRNCAYFDFCLLHLFLSVFGLYHV